MGHIVLALLDADSATAAGFFFTTFFLGGAVSVAAAVEVEGAADVVGGPEGVGGRAA